LPSSLSSPFPNIVPPGANQLYGPGIGIPFPLAVVSFTAHPFPPPPLRVGNNSSVFRPDKSCLWSYFFCLPETDVLPRRHSPFPSLYHSSTFLVLAHYILCVWDSLQEDFHWAPPLFPVPKTPYFPHVLLRLRRQNPSFKVGNSALPLGVRLPTPSSPFCAATRNSGEFTVTPKTGSPPPTSPVDYFNPPLALGHRPGPTAFPFPPPHKYIHDNTTGSFFRSFSIAFHCDCLKTCFFGLFQALLLGPDGRLAGPLSPRFLVKMAPLPDASRQSRRPFSPRARLLPPTPVISAV